MDNAYRELSVKSKEFQNNINKIIGEMLDEEDKTYLQDVEERPVTKVSKKYAYPNSDFNTNKYIRKHKAHA